MLDQIRDVILHNKGNETLNLHGTNLDASNNGSTELQNMFNDLVNSQSNKLGGMLLKTYDSDIFNNWVKTDWIDGAGGITEITSIDIRRRIRRQSINGRIKSSAKSLQHVKQNCGEWGPYRDWETDRKSTRLNSSHRSLSRMPSSA